MQALTGPDIFRLLDGATLHFIGDSMSRRAGKQLRSYLTHAPFVDFPDHNTVTHHMEEVGSGRAFTIQTHWKPVLDMLITSLNGTVLPPPKHPASPLYNSTQYGKRKVFVLAYSTHEFVAHWAKGDQNTAKRLATGLHREMQLFVGRLTYAVSLLKAFPGFKADRDVIIVRLPIAQACAGSMYKSLCDPGTGRDPVNTQLARVQQLMTARMQRDHPDVALVDVMSWTRNETGVGRDQCAAADVGGTHFASDIPRMAAVQQTLHAVSLMSADKPEWAGHSLGCQGH